MTHWPIYGRSDFSRWPHALIVFPAAAVLGYWAVGRGRRLALEVNRPAVALAGLCTASAITMFAFGFSERADRWIEIFNASKQFDRDAGQFTDVTDFLRNYTARMDGFSWFGQHYPPGNALVLGWLGVAGKYLFMLSAALSPVVVWLANRRLGGSTSAGWWAAALVAVAPVVLM